MARIVGFSSLRMRVPRGHLRRSDTLEMYCAWAMSKLIDLSHTIRNGLITYKGFPAPIICDYLTREASRKNYAEGTEFQIGRIDMVSHTGTTVDCPFHRYGDGKDLSEVGLNRFVDLPGVV